MTTKPTTLSKDPRSLRLPKAEYANISWITDSLAIGGDLSWKRSIRELQMAEIISQGITCVIDARMEDDDTDWWAGSGVTYVHVPTNDMEGSHIAFHDFDRAVLAARQVQRAGGKVLAHCHMGINRGPSMGAAILLDRGMAPVEAMRLIKARRPIAGIYYFMDAYDAHIARNGLTPNHGVRRAVSATWYALVRSPEAIKHVQRSINEHHARDRALNASMVADARTDWQDQERESGKDSRLWTSADQAWWDEQDAKDLEWQVEETELQAKEWASNLTEQQLDDVRAADIHAWIKAAQEEIAS